MSELANKPRLLALGDSAWTIEFGNRIDAQLNARVIGLMQRINQARMTAPQLACISDVVPTFRSLTVHFDPVNVKSDDLGQRLLDLAQNADGVQTAGHHWRLPLCFDLEFAPDLPLLAQTRKIPPESVMQQMLEAEFRVYMIGFLPGFPYMGGLPDALAMPRLPTPRTRVPAQSVAVAGNMCAIYPWDSPGGWNLLGRTPVPLFSLSDAQQHTMLSSGDVVRWYEVNRHDYDQMLHRAQHGQLPQELFLQKQAAPCPA